MQRTFSLTLEERQKKFGIFGKPTAVLGSCGVSVRCPRLFREFVVQDVHFCALFFKIELICFGALRIRLPQILCVFKTESL